MKNPSNARSVQQLARADKRGRQLPSRRRAAPRSRREAGGNGTVPLTVALAMEEIAMVADMIDRIQMKFLAGKLRGSYGTIADHLTRKPASGARTQAQRRDGGQPEGQK